MLPLKGLRTGLLIHCLVLCGYAFAAPPADEATACVMALYQGGDDTMTLAEMRQQCAVKTAAEQPVKDSATTKAASEQVKPGLISQRLYNESRTQFEPFVITPHRMNYVLPVYSTNTINRLPYENVNGYQENLAEVEAKYQLSFKVPLLQEDLFIDGDALYFGFTLQAWWQIYADNISKPFRETNYQPELFYLAPLEWHPLGGNTAFVIGAEHQSNGRTQGLSRSWNRIYGQFLFEKNNFALSFRPWTRVSEDEKASPLDPKGDDNPDIEDYMGHFELGMLYQWHDMELMFQGRNNFSTHNGAIELGLTFPLWGKLRGYATAFNGYGESLIDYNHKQTRFGIGIALNDIL